MTIDYDTLEGTDVHAFMLTWDDSTNRLVRGHMIIQSNTNDDPTYLILETKNITDRFTWLEFNVQNAVGSVPTNNEECIINFSRVGDKGQKGQKGEDNSTKGQKGDDNSTKGQKGEAGSDIKGQKGEPGDTVKGEPGSDIKGQKGEPGDDNSTKGQKGDTGSANTTQASTVKIETTHDNEYKKVLFVDNSTTNGQYKTPEIDSTAGDDTLTFNPSTNLLRTTGVLSKRMVSYNGGTFSVGSAGQVLTSQGGSGDWSWENISSLSGGFPSGGIIMWSGAQANIPTGWVLCDGNNSTPDLRNRFVIGAGTGGNYSVDDTGGSKDATLVSHSHTINNHTHTWSGTTSGDTHNHSWNYTSPDDWDVSGPGINPTSEGYGTYTVVTTNDTHSHTVSGTTSNPSDRATDSRGLSATNANLPPYYALCYIMKT